MWRFYSFAVLSGCSVPVTASNLHGTWVGTATVWQFEPVDTQGLAEIDGLEDIVHRYHLNDGTVSNAMHGTFTVRDRSIVDPEWLAGSTADIRDDMPYLVITEMHSNYFVDGHAYVRAEGLVDPETSEPFEVLE